MDSFSYCGRQLLVPPVLAVILFLGLASPAPVAATGEIGEHVKDLQAHLEEYTASVERFLQQTEALIADYESESGAAADAARLIDYWEEAKIHAAIEVNYAPIYAAIWQGIFGVKEAIESGQPPEAVREQRAGLERALWQALGAVKMAAWIQSGQGVMDDDSAPIDPISTIEEIRRRLDQVVSYYADNAVEEATTLVHDTYAYRFEGVEPELIEQDAELVLELEKDFNVTLPQLIAGGAATERVEQAVAAMHRKLERARDLLAEAKKDQRQIF